jgi:hypothetical protein
MKGMSFRLTVCPTFRCSSNYGGKNYILKLKILAETLNILAEVGCPSW